MFDNTKLFTYLAGLWRNISSQPNQKYSISATTLLIVFCSGILFFSSFNMAMEMTNETEFCISCHEMKMYVYEDHKDSIHFKNRTGINASCSDCHVPKNWFLKVSRKIRAASDVYHKILGTIDTEEKFQSRHLYLAQNVWREMKNNNSRECRTCHSLNSMEFEDQKGRASRKHKVAESKGKTCIDCHKGVAHELPDDYDGDSDNV